MRTQGFATLVAIVRRSLWIVLLLVALGVIQMNVIRHVQGSQYTARAHVILSPTDLGSLSGLTTFVDPTVVDQTEQALIGSPQLYAYAASQNHSLGNATDLENSTTASKTGSTITFTSTGSDADRALATVNLIANAYPSWRASVSGRSLDKAIAQLRDQQKTSKDPDIATELNKLRLLKTLTAGNVLLVESAQKASKTRPSPIKDSLLGGFIGLFVALLAIGVREALDSKVRTEEEVEDVLDVPVLGAIEALPRKVSVVLGGRDAERYGDMYALLAASLVQRRDGAASTVVAVTSATAEEGKTTTAINLAAALARRNVRVKLLDLDTRRPTIARLLRIPADQPGAEAVLMKGTDPSGLFWDVSMNGSGPSVRSARERLRGARESMLQVLPIRSSTVQTLAATSTRLEQLIAEARDGSEFVVIDTPPALSTSDVTELAKLVDLVLLVVRHGEVSRRNLEAMHRLHRTWPNVDVQAVMVGVPADGSSYSYYSHA